MNLHGPVRAPASAAAGKATVAISFDDWAFGGIAPSFHELEVAAPRPGPKLEPVSPRLKATLVHANKTGAISGLRWTPDGERLVAGDSPGGVVQVWQAVGGKQLARIEPGPGFRNYSDPFHLSPDGRTIYTSRQKVKRTRVEQGGKQLVRWEFDSDVRAWDAQTGALRDTFTHDPPHGVLAMTLSPDGSALVTQEHLPGETAGRPKEGASLWDVRTKRLRAVPAEMGMYGALSPDGGSLATVPPDAAGYETTIKLYDVASAKEKLSIPVREAAAFSGVWAFTPDGRAIVGYVRAFPKKKDWSTFRDYLRAWDAATGSELASFPAAEAEVGFGKPVFAPGGRTFCCATYGGSRAQLLIVDTAGWKLTRTVVLADKLPGERLVARDPAVSPDGRWAAVLSQALPADLRAGTAAPESLAQPRIHLIDLATGKIAETLFAPQGLATCLAFSPDGKTLASGGSGRVYLWDFTKPPGGR